MLGDASLNLCEYSDNNTTILTLVIAVYLSPLIHIEIRRDIADCGHIGSPSFVILQVNDIS